MKAQEAQEKIEALTYIFEDHFKTHEKGLEDVLVEALVRNEYGRGELAFYCDHAESNDGIMLLITQRGTQGYFATGLDFYEGLDFADCKEITERLNILAFSTTRLDALKIVTSSMF